MTMEWYAPTKIPKWVNTTIRFNGVKNSIYVPKYILERLGKRVEFGAGDGKVYIKSVLEGGKIVPKPINSSGNSIGIGIPTSQWLYDKGITGRYKFIYDEVQELWIGTKEVE